MTELLFTSRPLSASPISWANAATRIRTKGMVDHVALLKDGMVYESVVKKGVSKTPYKNWILGREGTMLIRVQVPDEAYDFDVFEAYRGTKYDTPAIAYLFFGLYKMLKSKSLKRIFCSELIAMMRYDKAPYHVTPYDELRLWDGNPSTITII